MKEMFINYSINSIKKYNPDYDEIKISTLKYGIEGFYLTISKMIIIITAAVILKIFKEFLLLMIVYNVLRTTGFGLHAKKSINCLISSIIFFIIVPLIAINITIPIIIKSVLLIISIILMFKYSPADTIKRPLIKLKKREHFKFITTINTIIFSFVCISIPNQEISNLILLAIYIETILILPITYKLTKNSYNNYENYDLN